jgi:hypothetical protein
MFNRNWLKETFKKETNRRVSALEAHIQDLEERFRGLQNAHNVAHPAPPRPPEGDDTPRNYIV